MLLETGLTLVLMNVKGLGEAEALKEPIDSQRSFPVMSTFSIVLAAFKALRHMLDFRSSMPCFGFGKENPWLGDLDNDACYEFCELFGCETKCLI